MMDFDWAGQISRMAFGRNLCDELPEMIGELLQERSDARTLIAKHAERIMRLESVLHSVEEARPIRDPLSSEGRKVVGYRISPDVFNDALEALLSESV